MTEKINQAYYDPFWSIRSDNGLNYDIKVDLSKNYTLDIQELKRDKNYDGYLYNGMVINGRGAGNILFGRNAENAILPTSFYLWGADKVHQNTLTKKNKLMFKNSNPERKNGETDEANKRYQIGINEQKNK